VLADDTLSADAAYRVVCEGSALVWQGDYQNARQMLQALARRVDRKPRKFKKAATGAAEAFHQHRQGQAQRARLLGQLLIPIDAQYRVALRRGPDVPDALREVWGEPGGLTSLVSLRELLGLVGAHEWRKKGVEVAALDRLVGRTPASGARIHPHYGVFSPVRGEYVDLVASAPLPRTLNAGSWVVDVGVGTGVLSAVLALRGAWRVMATDIDPRALACAAANLDRLGLSGRVSLLQTDLFPPGRADLVVCNPPWLPATPSSPIEHAIYDPDSRMLKAFIAGLADHLNEGAEGWLILSDLAEHLGLRSRAQLLGWIKSGGLTILGRLDARPRHPKAQDSQDPLHAARSLEVTTLWRLARMQSLLES
jgi:methylase of polypeptide subunit release factors